MTLIIIAIVFVLTILVLLFWAGKEESKPTEIKTMWWGKKK